MSAANSSSTLSDDDAMRFMQLCEMILMAHTLEELSERILPEYAKLLDESFGRNEWVSQAGALLEASIRLAPKAPFAETAYAILEEETLLDYGGLDGEALPPDVAANLAELRGLLGP